MKSILAFVLVSGIALSGTGRAADDPKPADKAESKPAAGEDTRSGKLKEKPANAAEGVVASLRSSTADVDIYLSASGDVATKIADLLKKGADVQVSGPINGGVMKVSQVAEVEAKKAAPADDEKMKGKGKKEKKKKKKEAAAN